VYSDRNSLNSSPPSIIRTLRHLLCSPGDVDRRWRSKERRSRSPGTVLQSISASSSQARTWHRDAHSPIGVCLRVLYWRSLRSVALGMLGNVGASHRGMGSRDSLLGRVTVSDPVRPLMRGFLMANAQSTPIHRSDNQTQLIADFFCPGLHSIQLSPVLAPRPQISMEFAGGILDD
jgi:hypothetical protein